jgi:hypothetical protein
MFQDETLYRRPMVLHVPAAMAWVRGLITTSAAFTTSVVSGFGYSMERSIPISSIAATTAGLISFAGVLPAERTWTPPCAWRSSKLAAI